ncbi:MAG: hypothetical protein IPJ88_05455 [Myxococcales bacterium]|nr:MAG: hypothetical protein IPJ88_05455 [Myxococcales bacterium]
MPRTRTAEKPIVEELHFRSDNAYLCLVLNRRTRTIRVIDFRAGALPAKRLFIQSVAQKEGVEKIITLVEKDEVSSWTKVGFIREGQIPGFYKRSDGHLLGCVVNDSTASIEMDDESLKQAERTVNAAKRAANQIPDPITGVALKVVEEKAAHSARDQVWKKGIGVGSFDTFGRGVERLYVEAVVGGKNSKRKPNYITAEYQDCFGHSLIEVLRSPEDDQEMIAVCGALQTFAEELKRRGIISAFGFAASDDVALATAYAGAGFRKTGLLAKGIVDKGERKDAILWTRKLAIPGDEDKDKFEN